MRSVWPLMVPIWRRAYCGRRRTSWRWRPKKTSVASLPAGCGVRDEPVWGWGRLTDAGCVQNVGTSGMEVCKPSEVVDFGVDDDPLQRTVSDGSCSDEETCQVASLVVLRFDRRSVRTTYEAKSTLIYLCNLIGGELLALGRHSDRLNLWSELQPGALTCCQWGEGYLRYSVNDGYLMG